MAGSPAPQEFVGEKFSLFVGSIVEGVENGWLERILGVRAHSLHSPTLFGVDE